MGYFDYRCMISGLSLRSSRTALVLLEKLDNNYVPIGFPIFGQYNRLGAIDMILEDENANHILNFFQSRIKSGDININWQDIYWQGEPLSEIGNIGQLLAAVERGVTMQYDCVTFKGRRIIYSLIDYKIWDGLTFFEFENRMSGLVLSDTWKEIYKQQIPFYGNYIFEFKNVNDFLNKHNIKWVPPNNSGQYSEEEENDFLRQTKSKFIDEPLVMDGVSAYEKELKN
jgi:hypothetical protein